jgi:hypothetical protein
MRGAWACFVISIFFSAPIQTSAHGAAGGGGVAEEVNLIKRQRWSNMVGAVGG